MTQMAQRGATRLIGGCVLTLAVILAGCATPQYADVSVPKTNFHFQIPRAWDQINSSSLTIWLKARSYNTRGAWIDGYDAGPQPSAADSWNYHATRPFVFAEYIKLSSSEREMSYGHLRDFYLPVTSTARQNAIAQGFQFTSFRQIRDQPLSLGQGTQGFRETYDYTSAGHADTFDEDVVTNAGHTAILLLVVHCTTTCYNSYRTEIDYLMSSVILG